MPLLTKHPANHIDAVKHTLYLNKADAEFLRLLNLGRGKINDIVAELVKHFVAAAKAAGVEAMFHITTDGKLANMLALCRFELPSSPEKKPAKSKKSSSKTPHVD